MGNLNFSLGKVRYDNMGLSTFPLEAQIGVGVGASIVALIVLIIVLIYRSAGVHVCLRALGRERDWWYSETTDPQTQRLCTKRASAGSTFSGGSGPLMCAPDAWNVLCLLCQGPSSWL